MNGRNEIWLNNVALTEIDPGIYITDIAYSAVSPERHTAKLAGRDGSYSADTDSIGKNVITVTFMQRHYSTSARQTLAQAVMRWCSAGGWLKASDRPNQKIYVRCSQYPVIKSVTKWTDTVSLQFAAYDYPYWLDDDPAVIECSNGQTKTGYLAGVKRSDITAKITATDALTWLQMNVGSTMIRLENLTVSAGDEIIVDYSANHHILGISCNGTSLLHLRTAASSDDLVAEIGENSFVYSASGASVCKYYVRGVYV